MRQLTKRQDAFGRGIWDWCTGQWVGHEIVERDDGWVALSPGSAAYFAEFADWSEHEKEAIRLAKGHVLDVGCGAGRVGLHLQKKGLEVTGIDNSPLAIKVCRMRGLKKAKVASITEFRVGAGAFDTIVMFGNGFGLTGNFRRARWLLRRFHRMSSPGARILAASADPYRTEVSEHLEYHRRNRRRGRMAGQIRIRVRYRKHATPWWDLLLVSTGEMQTIVDGTGWALARSFDSKGAGYVAVLEKA